MVLALVLLASVPFLARPGLPRDTDAELHVFRTAQVRACWEQGVFYPRWAPDFYYGYGYPIFNYYAPLTYHIGSALSFVPGLDVVAAVKGVFVLGLLLGGMGSYLVARDLSGAAAGIVAAAVFLFSPYVLFIDPHARGDLAEHFALGLLPMAVFFQRRLVERGGRAHLLGFSICIACLPLSHNLLGVVGLGVLLAAFVWQVTVEGRRDGVGRGALGFAIAGALSAFFWLPLLLELNAVKLTVVGPGHFDFRNHFVTLAELLAPSRRIDMGAMAPNFHHNVGLAAWGLALAGAAVLLRRDLPARWALLFFVAASAGLLFLMTPASRFVWERVPGLEYLQFPWRLLGTAAFTLAVLAGAAVHHLPGGGWRPAWLAGTVLAVLLLALPTTFAYPWEPDFGDTSPAGIVAFELEGKVVGTTSTGDFLPRTVDMPPQPLPSLVESYLGPGPVDKVNRATLPDGTDVRILEHGPTHDRFATSSQRNFYLRIYTLLFPGWHAYVDGEEVALEVGRPEGSFYFPVPAGDHDVLVRFEDTAPRRAGWWIAAGGALVLGLALAFVRAPVREAAPDPARRIDVSVVVWVGGALVLFALFRYTWVESQAAWFRHHSAPGEAAAARYQQRAVLGGQIELLGFDLPQRRVRPGEAFEITLYWRALGSLEVNYQSFVHLTQPSTMSWGQSDALNPGGLPTTRWSPDRYVWDVHRVQVRPEAAVGTYTLEVGLYTLADGQRLPVLSEDGAPSGATTVVLDVPVEVLPRGWPSWEVQR